MIQCENCEFLFNSASSGHGNFPWRHFFRFYLFNGFCKLAPQRHLQNFRKVVQALCLNIWAWNLEDSQQFFFAWLVLVFFVCFFHVQALNFNKLLLEISSDQHDLWWVRSKDLGCAPVCWGPLLLHAALTLLFLKMFHKEKNITLPKHVILIKKLIFKRNLIRISIQHAIFKCALLNWKCQNAIPDHSSRLWRLPILTEYF